LSSGCNRTIEPRADVWIGRDVPCGSAGSACPRLLQSNRTAPPGPSFAPARTGVFLLYQRRKGEIQMKNPLDSLWGTIISGLVLTVILYFVVKSILG
jgi:hypothetical protein